MKTNKRLLLGVCAGLLVGAAALTTASALAPDAPQDAVLLANAEALSKGETDEWHTGYKTGTLTVEGVTVDCCVKAATTDACNYGLVSCITL